MGNSFKDIGEVLLPAAGAVAGGLIGGPAGAAVGMGLGSATSSVVNKPETPSINIATKTADPSLSTPTTPENSPTQVGTGDSTDTGFGDVTSIFSSLNRQEDEWDKFLGRYSKK